MYATSAIFPQLCSDNMLPTAGTLPLELLITVLSFLPDVRAIATCACVSRLWARAAGVAVPEVVDLHYLGNSQAACCLLRKPHLGAVESVSINFGGGFAYGAILVRICAEAKALQECKVFR